MFFYVDDLCKSEKLAVNSSKQEVDLTKESGHTDPRDKSTLFGNLFRILAYRYADYKRSREHEVSFRRLYCVYVKLYPGT